MIGQLAGCDLVFGLDPRPVDAGPGAEGPGSEGPGGEDSPVGVKVVFATKRAMTGAMGGLVGADATCQADATEAALPGTFKAWLSDGSESPSIRMTRHPGPYVLTNSHPVATSWDDLTDGMLTESIHVTANGLATTGIAVCGGIHAGVWSSTAIDGTLAGTATCTNWTSNDPGLAAPPGDLLATNAFWTLTATCVVPCDTPMQIYCVEQ